MNNIPFRDDIWAVVVDGNVTNVIVCDNESDISVNGQLVKCVPNNIAQVGGTYKDGVFLPPPEPDPEV